jgi:phosphatidylserine decarboxylase
MTLVNAVRQIAAHEDLNFLLTNRIPRLAVTRLMGQLSQIDSPLFARSAIALWRLFTDLDLNEAQETNFRSVHACFTRALKPGARPIDATPGTLVSPCDGIVGACGAMQGLSVFQAKGFAYALSDLIPDAALARQFANGQYVTLRLTSAMYHRFHAPADLHVEHVTHIAGDTWNVNPIALRRVEKLFCRNERAVLRCRLTESGHTLLLVPVAAILVASLRLHFAHLHLHGRYTGPDEIPCAASLTRGDEMGWFEHGSTILVFAPPGVRLAPGIREGHRIQMGEALLQVQDAK